MRTQKAKILFNGFLLIVLSSNLFLSCQLLDTDSDPSSSNDPSTLSITDLVMQPGSDISEMNFCWYSSDTRAAVVQIALKSAMVSSNFPESSSAIFYGTTADFDDYISNEVEVSDLDTDTEYVYRVGDGTNFSEVYSFATHSGSSFSAILVGDPQIGSSGSVSDDQDGWKDTVTIAINSYPKSSFILSVGDHVETSTSEEQYSAFFSPDELTSIPLVSAIGNHDNSSLYSYHFNSPNESSNYGTTSAGGDYWFTYGKSLFMVLNSNNQSATAHEAFISDAITDAGSDIVWKIVVFHHSIYSSARHSQDGDIVSRRSDLYPIFDTYDVDVVLMGHDHVYSRSYQMYGGEAQISQTEDSEGRVVNPTGTLYITLNSASGSKYYDLIDADTAYRAKRWQGKEPSYSNMEITDTTFTITTYTSADNTEIDTYSIYKGDSE